MTEITKSTSGLIDYCLAQVEELDKRDDIDVDKRLKYSLALIKEARNWGGLELQYKRLLAQSPDIIGNEQLSMNVGTKLIK